MGAELSKLIQFKFRWIDQAGNATGFLRTKGSFDGDTLTLGDVVLPAAVIAHVGVRETNLAMSAIADDGQMHVLAINVTNPLAKQLKQALDSSRSAFWAQQHLEELSKKGRKDAYRADVCPKCNATSVLTDMPLTPQIYCRFCDTLRTVDPNSRPPADEPHLRICDECGMFSKPRKFTIFYFYFLLVVYGFWSKPTWRCPACMRGDAWKMLFGNLIFLLGVPVAIIQLVRSYGGTAGIGPYAGLDGANLKARKGDILGALEKYQGILDRVPHAAGVKYNVGLALRTKGEIARAGESFRLSLADCSNYEPSYHALVACYEATGELEKLRALRQVWGMTDQEESEEETLEKLLPE